jgi:ELWxxDGT repeat protein
VIRSLHLLLAGAVGLLPLGLPFDSRAAQAGSDGVPDSGAVLLLRSGMDAEGPGVLLNGRLVFFAATLGTDEQVWSTDGTEAGTVRLSDITWSHGDRPAYDVTAFDGRVWFFATGASGQTALWSTDGTAAGTSPFAEVGPGPQSRPTPVVAGGDLFFTAFEEATGDELWVTDGTEGGTHLVKDLAAGMVESLPDDLTSIGDRVVFTAFAGPDGPRRPWVSDGTSGGTRRLDSGQVTDLDASYVVAVGTGALFSWGDATTGEELWATGGVPGDAHLVDDIRAGAAGSEPHAFLPYAGRVVFQATTAKGTELWQTDGTAAGTSLVLDLAPGAGSSFPIPAGVIGGRLYFVANDGPHGYELWSTLGTPESTTLLADLDPGAERGVEGDGFSLADGIGGELFLAADDGTTGFEPWATDGTAAGTHRLADLEPGPDGSDPASLGVAGGAVVFSAVVGDEAGLYAWSPTAPPRSANPRATSVTTARPKHRYSAARARHGRLVVPVTVTSSAALPDGGTVVLTRKGRVIGSAPLLQGRARIHVTARLRPRHRYVVAATWSGTTTVDGSVSAPFRIRIVAT